MKSIIRRKPKRFSYQPRFYKSSVSPYEIKGKYDDFRTTKYTPRGLKAKINRALKESLFGGERIVRIRLLIIMAILILIALYIIDFDLTIFYRHP